MSDVAAAPWIIDMRPKSGLSPGSPGRGTSENVLASGLRWSTATSSNGSPIMGRLPAIHAPLAGLPHTRE